MRGARFARDVVVFTVAVACLSGAITWWRVRASERRVASPGPAPTNTSASPDPLEDHAQITFILSGSIQAELGPCGCSQPPRGGLARRTTAIEEIRRSRKNKVFVLECGDSFFSGSSRVSHAFKEQSVRKAEVDQQVLK